MLALVSKANKNQELGFGSSDQDLIMVLKITGTKTSELFIVYNFTSIWDQRVQYCLQFYIHLRSESPILFTNLHPFGIRESNIVYNFTSIWDQRVHYCLQFYIHLGSESSLLFTILHPFGFREFIIVYNFTSIWDQRVHQTKGRSRRTDCPLVLVACHKLGQGDCVRSLHEPSKSARVNKTKTGQFLPTTKVGAHPKTLVNTCG